MLATFDFMPILHGKMPENTKNHHFPKFPSRWIFVKKCLKWGGVSNRLGGQISNLCHLLG